MFHSFNSTGIGSLPHKDPFEACKVIFDSVDIPFWPQLPHRSFHELMVPQYSEGFPFIKIEGENIYINDAEEAAETAFYESIANKSGFPISRDYAAGFYAFIEMLKERGGKYEVIKGHITGPLTFCLSLTDSRKRPIFFDDEKKELSLELLKGKVSWQIDELGKYADKVLIFADEPILSALGTSTYVGVSNEEASRLLKEIVKYIQECGGIAGIHCCGKADWPLVLSSGIDVFNYDSYYFWDTLGLYPADIKDFIERGGVIASGIIPTTDAIKSVTLPALKEQFERGLTALEKAGVPSDKLRDQILITPSCGTGSLDTEDALKAFSLLKELRNSYVKG
jgi:methionine synthase II (cobalamin-independent)